MIFQFKNFTLFADTEYFDPPKKTILFIHGFTGSSKDWSEIIPNIDNDYSCIAIDLVGHGLSCSPMDKSFYEIDSITDQINFVLDSLNIKGVILLGYSMGGRVALNFALKYPQCVTGLILESSTAGLEGSKERTTRSNNDVLLANKIMDEGVESFIEYWLNLPIFSSQKNLPNKIKDKIKENKFSNSSRGLSNSLIGFSTGKMYPLWGDLRKYSKPVLLIAGSLDEKYVQINQKLSHCIKTSELEIVEDAGHNIHLEKPSEFIILVNRFLRTYFT